MNKAGRGVWAEEGIHKTIRQILVIYYWLIIIPRRWQLAGGAFF